MNNTIRPCFWMRVALNRMTEGRMRGPLAWYAKNHVAKCPQCSATYKMLLAMREGLHRLNQDSTANWIVSEEKWRAIEDACKNETQE